MIRKALCLAAALAAFNGIATAQSAKEMALLAEMSAILATGTPVIAGSPLPAPEPTGKNGLVFGCSNCTPRYVAFISFDIMEEEYGTTSLEEVAAIRGDCPDLDCEVRLSEYRGLQTIEGTFTFMNAKTSDRIYALPDGGDLLLTLMMHTDDDITSAFVDLEAALMPPLLDARL